VNQKQSPSDSYSEINWGYAFRAQAIRSIPDVPVVMSAGIVRGSGSVKASRSPHWLSRFVTYPTAASGIGEKDEQSARNIADWSSYLPADCVDMMVSLGWDRTT
jgi:hypothetical protein